MRKRAAASRDQVAAAVRIAFGVIFLSSSGVHIGIVAADAELYRDVADGAFLPGIATAWQNIFMAHPVFWGLMITVGEFAIGAALLSGGRWGPYGVAGAATFHVGLMMLGWGYWMWSMPVLAILLGPGRPRRTSPSLTGHHVLGPPGDDLLSSTGTRRS